MTVVGLLMIYSATHANTALNFGDPYFFVKKQLASVVFGLAGIILVLFLDYRLSDLAAQILYVFNLLFLALVLVFGERIGGAKAWLHLGFFSVQPAEFAKLFVIFTLAKLLAENENLNTFKGLFLAIIHVLPSLVLILLQPDLGTAMVYVFIFFVMLFMAGVRIRYLLGLILLGVGLLGAMWCAHYYFDFPFFFKDYQINRLLIFLNPDRDPTGAGWNVRQAVIAVGSGRFFGKGLFQNTQGQLGFLPENHTDFIFAVFCEEWGFVGGFILLAMFFFLIWRSLRIAQHAKDKYGTLIASGIMAMFLFHILENVGMNIGIMPVTGIPLPFISYGGSAMTNNLLCIGCLQSIWVRRQKILF